MIKTILKQFQWGFLEEIITEECGLVRVKGWSKAEVPNFKLKLLSGQFLSDSLLFRTYRPDIPLNTNATDNFLGFVIEFICFEPFELFLDDRAIYNSDFKTYHAHYESLLSETKVYHRDQIYRYGPPVKYISEPVEKIARTLNGSILDFGCGIGIAVRTLRDNNIEAFGIELDRDAISEGIDKDIADFITLYDGNFPTPFEDKSFDNLLCVEVLEHIPDYENALHEFSRITRDKVVITVPDMSSIPTLHKHGVVPWHLLESTHVNFFTQQSLGVLLSKYFNDIEFIRIHPFTVNETTVFTSLVAICSNKV
jgi:SAM-dependent methyltransferase